MGILQGILKGFFSLAGMVLVTAVKLLGLSVQMILHGCIGIKGILCNAPCGQFRLNAPQERILWVL